MSNIKLKNVFLTISLTGLALTICDRQPTVLSYMFLPVSAILFGLFMIWTVLEKESALFDEQNRDEEPAVKRMRPERSQSTDVLTPILSARWH